MTDLPRDETVRLTEAELKVLMLLSEQHEDYGCLDFKTIGSDTGLDDLKQVRRVCRSLKRKGLAEFHQGLWSDDGEPRGSGYCASRAARALHEKVRTE